MLEIEVKIRIPDPRALREALVRAGAVLEKERHAESNILYDFRGGSLKAKGVALRLREAGPKAFLTFKGAPRKSRRFKIREEFETEVRNVKQARRILRGLGLTPAFAYDKFRTVFRKDHVKVCLDETAVGVFAEFEGERSDIVKLVKKLGFSPAEMIKRDYIAMMLEAGRRG